MLTSAALPYITMLHRSATVVNCRECDADASFVSLRQRAGIEACRNPKPAKSIEDFQRL